MAVSYSRKNVGAQPVARLKRRLKYNSSANPRLDGDLLDRLQRVQEVPFCLLEDPLADQLRQRLVQVRLTSLPRPWA